MGSTKSTTRSSYLSKGTKDLPRSDQQAISGPSPPSRRGWRLWDPSQVRRSGRWRPLAGARQEGPRATARVGAGSVAEWLALDLTPVTGTLADQRARCTVQSRRKRRGSRGTERRVSPPRCINGSGGGVGRRCNKRATGRPDPAETTGSPTGEHQAASRDPNGRRKCHAEG
jgi:hypothetical protein